MESGARPHFRCAAFVDEREALGLVNSFGKKEKSLQRRDSQ